MTKNDAINIALQALESRIMNFRFSGEFVQSKALDEVIKLEEEAMDVLEELLDEEQVDDSEL